MQAAFSGVDASGCLRSDVYVTAFFHNERTFPSPRTSEIEILMLVSQNDLCSSLSTFFGDGSTTTVTCVWRVASTTHA